MVYEIGNLIVDDVVWWVFDGDEFDWIDGIVFIVQLVEFFVVGVDYVCFVCFDGIVDVCFIVNVKVGDCVEDCGFCVQLVYFDIGIEMYGFFGVEVVLDVVWCVECDGVQWFGIVVVEKGVLKEC